MSKYIQIDSPWGQYNLPLRIVAEDRARYYANDDYDLDPDYETDPDGAKDRYYESLVRLYMSEERGDFENIDWLQDNMEWSKVKRFAKQVHNRACCAPSDFWNDWEYMRVVEIDDTGQLSLVFTGTL